MRQSLGMVADFEKNGRLATVAAKKKICEKI
jgi:hypothetical protein